MDTGTCHRGQVLAGETGLTFVELLAVVLLLGILVLVAVPNYLGAESDARSAADRANVREINAALALWRYRNGGDCPGAEDFADFLGSTHYFPDGRPVDPWTNPPSSDPYVDTSSAALCRVRLRTLEPLVDHTTGAGH